MTQRQPCHQKSHPNLNDDSEALCHERVSPSKKPSIVCLYVRFEKGREEERGPKERHWMEFPSGERCINAEANHVARVCNERHQPWKEDRARCLFWAVSEGSRNSGLVEAAWLTYNLYYMTVVTKTRDRGVELGKYVTQSSGHGPGMGWG